MRNKLMIARILTPTLLAMLLFVAAGNAFGQPSPIKLTLEADRDDYLGPCPKDVKLKGRLQAIEPLGVVRYQFVHSDGTAGEVMQLTISHKGEYIVEANLRQNLSWNDTVYLRVFSAPPEVAIQADSNRIHIKGECQFAHVVSPELSLSLSPASGRFRVTLTGFIVNHETTESVISTDGAGDEVFALVNFAEIWSANNIFGALQLRQSLLYGDTSGHRDPVAIAGIPLVHQVQPTVIKAGRASTTGGLISNDRIGLGGELPAIPANADATTRARLIPMILWEGELRRGGPHPNAVVILPTIWENDNVPDVLNVWNRQADNWIRHFAANSARFISGTGRPLVEQVDTVLSTIPQRNDFDRPVGMDGDAFNPVAASPSPATFIPAVMLLTFNSAQDAANSTTQGRGMVEITYRDGQRYGPGSYTIFLRVERLP